MRFFYTLFIYAYGFFIRLASVGNGKARSWARGRKDWKTTLRARIKGEKPVAWFHCASLGEFEQGRPVLEAFRAAYPAYSILLTFFSPSGYKVKKNYPLAEVICYLPLDTPGRVRYFLDTVQPELAFFIKYEYWFNFLSGLKKRDIPVFVISGIFRPSQHFFRWYGAWFRKQLRQLTHFFLQDENSAALLRGIGISRVLVSGDTRFDRVGAIAVSPKKFPAIEGFIAGMPVFLAGSTWPADEAILLSYFRELKGRCKFIIAPHEVHEPRITALVESCGLSTLRFSRMENPPGLDFDLLIIDSIGQLSSLYQYAHLAYIGGGFGKGIHNILEAATFGLPVLFGPNYHRFKEARDLVQAGGAFAVSNKAALQAIADKLLNDSAFRENSGQASQQHVRENQGATRKILDFLAPFIRDKA